MAVSKMPGRSARETLMGFVSPDHGNRRGHTTLRLGVNVFIGIPALVIILLLILILT